MKLKFDEATHTYTLGRQVLPSVTQVLDPLNEELAKIPAHILNAAAARGTAVHKATELYDLGTLDESSVHEVVRPYLDAWVRFRDETGFVPTSTEQRLYHAARGYAGTVDRTGPWMSGKAVLDIKTTLTMYRTVGPQLAAYEELENQASDEPVTHRVAVQLKDNGTYKIHPYESPEDWPNFLAALRIHQWRNAA